MLLKSLGRLIFKSGSHLNVSSVVTGLIIDNYCSLKQLAMHYASLQLERKILNFMIAGLKLKGVQNSVC